MTLEANTESSPGYTSIPSEHWQGFFDAFTKVLEGNDVEIEVVGLEFGDQIQAESLPLNGLTYDRKDDTFYIYSESDDRDLDHAIAHPREILVRTGGAGIEQVVVVDAESRQHIIRLRQPLMLPDHASP